MRRLRQVNPGLPCVQGEVRVTPAHALADAPVARAALRRRVPRLPAPGPGADRPPRAAAGGPLPHVFEGTRGGKDAPDAQWRPYEFQCKPGDPDRRPCVVSPYHLRLD